MERYKKILVFALLCAFLLTVSYALYFRIEPTVDADAYDAIAKHLVEGRGYVENPNLTPAEDSAIGRVGPGYMFFLFLIYKFFGQNYVLVWLIQAVLHVATGWFIYLIAKKTFKDSGEWIGIISAGLYLFFIDVLQMTAMLMTESLFIFLTVLSVYLFVRFNEKASPLNALWLGLATALTILTRPTALLFLFVFVAYALSKRYWKEAVLLIVCSIAVIGPWTLRNYVIYDRFIFTTAAGGYDLWVGNNEEANGELEASPIITEYLETYGVESADEEGLKRVKEFALNHPVRFIGLQFQKTSIYFSAGRPSAFWFHLSGMSKILTIIASGIFTFVVFSFGFAGIWSMWKAKEKLYRWLVLLALTAPLAVIPIIVETRYRFPLYPLMSIFAGYFMFLLHGAFRKADMTSFKSHSKVFVVSFSIVFLNTAFDLLRNIDVVKDKLSL